MRTPIDFDSFYREYIANPDGYFPVYSALEEDDAGRLLKVMEIDLICEWRLGDGKVKFLSVPFDTKGQYYEIVRYLQVTADLLHAAILKRISALTYPEAAP